MAENARATVKYSVGPVVPAVAVIVTGPAETGGVGNGVPVAVGVAVAVAVAVGVGVNVAVAVGVGLGETLGSGVGVGIGEELHDGNLNDPTRVAQPAPLVTVKYSLVCQKVQLSVESTNIVL